jgi:type II secretory pathway pseudopilin PulG
MQNSSFLKTRLFGLILAIVVVAVGFGGSILYASREAATVKKKLHAEIASLRTYQESYALRHGHYLLLPDSCRANDREAWKKLGRTAPDQKIGCFEISSAQTGSTPAPATSGTMVIIAISPDGKLKGVESSEDSRPTWVTLAP